MIDSPAAPDEPDQPVRVAFLMESLRPSGGHQVVAEYARRLVEHHGFEVTIVAQQLRGGLDLGDAVSVVPSADVEEEPTFDLAVATWWETAGWLDRVPARRRAYFVQSLEDRFSEPGDERGFLAGLTYSMGLPMITEARWIARVLRSTQPTAPCHLVLNGIDKDIFPVGGTRPPEGDGPLRILIEGGTWNPVLKGVPEALESLSEMTEPAEVTLVGEVGELAVPAGVTVRGPVAQSDLSTLYAGHDVLLKLSRVEGMFAPPLEAFHRGATVVTTPVSGHEEFVVHGVNGLVTDWDDPRGTARLLDLLARDRDLLARLRGAALETATGWPSWDQAAGAFAAALREIIAAPPHVDLATAVRMYHAAERFASESATARHELKATLDLREEHLAKLDHAWQTEAARARHFEEETRRRSEDLEASSARVNALQGERDLLRAELDATVWHRLVRRVRSVRRRFRSR